MAAAEHLTKRGEILIEGGNIPQGIYLLSVLNDYNEIVYSTKFSDLDYQCFNLTGSCIY